MKMPRVSIGLLMALVALAAADFALVGVELGADDPHRGEVAAVGLLGMGDVVALGSLRLYRDRGRNSRPFKAFVGCGAAILAAYLLASWLFFDPLLDFLRILMEPAEAVYGRVLAPIVDASGRPDALLRSVSFGFLAYLAIVLAILQIIPASAFGWLASRYRIVRIEQGGVE